MNKQYLLATLLIPIMIFSGSSSFTNAQTEEIVVYATPHSFDSYSHFAYGSPADIQWQSATYAGFYRRENDGNSYSSVLASGEPLISVGTDEMTVIVNLQTGLRFYNGDSLTATDVLFSYQMMLSPLVNEKYGDMLYYFDSNESIYAISDYAVSFTINHVDPFYKHVLTLPIFSETTYGPRYATGDFDYNNPDGSDANGAGPYRVDYIDDIYEVHLRPNPYWIGDAPGLDELVFKLIPDKSVALTELDSRDVHILDRYYYHTLDELEGHLINIAIYNKGFTQEMAFNHDNGYLNGSLTPVGTTEAGKAVRKAFSHIIPREVIVNDILNGLGSPANTLIPPTINGLVGTETYPVREYNVETAKALMEQAGYDYSVDVNLTEPITTDNCLFEVYILTPDIKT